MKYRKPLTTTVAVLLGLPATFAQTDTPDANTPAEAVVITGSNIKRTDYEGPQTVVVFDRKKIEQTGAQTVSQLLQRLPQNAGGFTEGFQTGLSFSPGAAAASLRGLGVSSTLVLINGRRSAPFPFASGGTDSFVDLNSIPLAAVDRVEILKEGASAVYGSDAIAGVINVILKQNYSGGEAETYYGNTNHKDAGEVRESFVSGFSNERFHVMLTGNYEHRNSLASVDRAFSANADKRNFGGGFDLRSSRGNPGTIFASTGDFAVPRGSNGKLGVNDFLPGETPDGNIRNRFNFDKYTELIPETERWGGLITFGYNLTPHIELFGEAGYQSVRTKTVIAPTPPDSAGDGLIVPATNPHNPFGEDVSFLWRSVETGPRRDTIEADSYRYLAGFKVKDLPNNWSVEGAVLYSESNAVDYATAGYLGVAKTQAALNRTDNGALNVFGDGFGINDKRTLKGLLVFPRDDGLSYLWNYDIKASGELFQLPAGPLGLAFGAEYREESLSQKFSAPTGTIVGFGGAGSAGNRDVRSLYVETSIPVNCVIRVWYSKVAWSVPWLASA